MSGGWRLHANMAGRLHTRVIEDQEECNVGSKSEIVQAKEKEKGPQIRSNVDHGSVILYQVSTPFLTLPAGPSSTVGSSHLLSTHINPTSLFFIPIFIHFFQTTELTFFFKSLNSINKQLKKFTFASLTSTTQRGV